jgi:hypothetical protein
MYIALMVSVSFRLPPRWGVQSSAYSLSLLTSWARSALEPVSSWRACLARPLVDHSAYQKRQPPSLARNVSRRGFIPTHSKCESTPPLPRYKRETERVPLPSDVRCSRCVFTSVHFARCLSLSFFSFFFLFLRPTLS